MNLIAQSFILNQRQLDEQYALCSFDNIDIMKETSIKYTTNKTDLTPFRSRIGLYSTQFTEVLSFELTIIKCNGDLFSEEELSNLIQWLTPVEYQDFAVIDFPESTYHKNIIYHVVSLGYDEYCASGGIVGLKFYFECDAPYGFAPQISHSFTGGTPITIENNTEDVYDTYPILTIACKSTEEITFQNNRHPNEIMKLQVKNGQKLTIDNRLGIIDDSLHLFNYEKDTNRVWLHLSSGTNIITITGNITGTIAYQNIRKRGI